MNNQAELISIGSELLSGRTLNAHAQTLGGALAAIGLQLVRDTTIPDELPIIGSAVEEALARIDLLFVSGGLGPTVDDITREALAAALGRGIVLDAGAVEAMARRYAARGRPMTPAAERQALVLEGAVVLPNPVGAAPGERIDLPGDKTLFVLPGPPNEFNAILEESILPWLRRRYAHARPRPVRIVRTKGIGESDIVTILEREGFRPEGIALGFYPAMGKVEIRLSTEPDHASRVAEAEDRLRSLLAGFIEDVIDPS